MIGIGHNGGPFFAPMAVRPTGTPQTILGSKMVAFVDAEDNAQITNIGGTVSEYVDIVNGAGYAQAVEGSRPLITVNAVTGRQVFSFDGMGMHLGFEGIPTGVPTGSNPGDIIAIVSQLAPYAPTGVQKTIVSYGGITTAQNRVLQRNVASELETSVLRLTVGDGSSSFQVNNNLIDFYGNHLAYGSVTGTELAVALDGAFSTPVSWTPNTGTTRFRIGSSTSNTANTFFQGELSALILTNAILTEEELNAIAIWAGPRIWG